MRRQQEDGVPLDLNPIQRVLLWVFNGVVAFFVVGVGIHAVVAGALARDVLQAAFGVGIIAVVVVTIANLREAGRGVLTERGITLLGFFGRTRHMQWSEIERTEQGSVGARPQSVPVLSVYARGKKQPWIFGRAMANLAIVARAAKLAEHGRPEASSALIREHANDVEVLNADFEGDLSGDVFSMATDGGGNHYCLAVDGKVVIWNHEESNIEDHTQFASLDEALWALLHYEAVKDDKIPYDAIRPAFAEYPAECGVAFLRDELDER